MEVGDLVKFEADSYRGCRTGMIVAELPAEGVLNDAVSVLWASGELVERMPPRILEVINESR